MDCMFATMYSFPVERTLLYYFFVMLLLWLSLMINKSSKTSFVLDSASMAPFPSKSLLNGEHENCIFKKFNFP